MFACVKNQSFSEIGKTIGGQAIGDYEDAEMRSPFVIELHSQANKIVSISSDHNALFKGGPIQLFEIRKPFGLNLMRADGVEVPTA